MAIDWDAALLAPVMRVFGEDLPCRYMPQIGVPFDLVDAVYDAESGEVEPDGDFSSQTVRRPVLGVRLALFAAAGAAPPQQGDRVWIAPPVAAAFMVSDVRPDGHGHAKLMLMTAEDQYVL